MLDRSVLSIRHIITAHADHRVVVNKWQQHAPLVCFVAYFVLTAAPSPVVGILSPELHLELGQLLQTKANGGNNEIKIQLLSLHLSPS
jgi:hypothetical protein